MPACDLDRRIINSTCLLSAQVEDRLDMIPRDNQYLMMVGLFQALEGNHEIIFVNEVSRNVARYDVTKDTSAHTSSPW